MRYAPYLIFLVLAAISPFRKELYSWPVERLLLYNSFFNYHVWLPLLLLPLILNSERHPKSLFAHLLDRVSDIRIINPVTYVLLAGATFLTIVGIPGLWWSWMTVGVHLTGIGLIANFLRGRLRPSQALFLGIGCVSVAASSWEIMYQVGYYFRYGHEVLPFSSVVGPVLFVTPLLVLGLVVIVFYLHQKPSILKVGWKVHSLALLFITSLVLWWVLGFWVDIIYDANDSQWHYTQLNSLQMFIYKGSKSVLALSFAVLFLERSRSDVTL